MRLAGVARTVGLALTVILIVVLTGCAQPSYRFVSNNDHDLVMRLPRNWTPVDSKASLKASGIDPGTAVRWTAFFDASPKPSVDHMKNVSTDDPILFAESVPLTADERAGVTAEAMREILLPGTAADRTAAAKIDAYRVLESNDIATKTESGAHVRYSFKIGKVTEIFDRIALTDPKHTKVDLAFAHCSAACYQIHATEIQDAVTSLTLKPAP